MGREIKRVPVDFDWPLTAIWEGYLMPDELRLPQCPDCAGRGDTVARRYLDCIAHVLMLVGEAGVRDSEPHPWLIELPLSPCQKPGADAAELSAGLAGREPRTPFGHDAIDRWNASKKIVAAAGLPETWGICPTCSGSGNVATEEQKSAHEAWERSEPPTGVGWQLWETVSEGSPISPVFPTPEGLVEWLTSPAYTWGASTPLTREQAERLVEAGWAPTFIGSPRKGVVPGEQVVGGDS